MIVTLQSERIRTIGQVAAFVEGSEPVDFQPTDRAGIYTFVARTLARLGYSALDRPSKTLVKLVFDTCSCMFTRNELW